MNTNSKIAAYALEKAQDIFFDVTMKGPCRCAEFMELCERIKKDMEELEWVIHCWNEETGTFNDPRPKEVKE